MLSVNRVGLALSALALTACAETQAPNSPNNAPPGDPSIASHLPVLQTARTDLASAQTSGPFNVTLRFVTPSSGKQKQVFRLAAKRWQEIIVKDVPSTTGTIPADFCGDLGTPEFSGTIDDILIDVLLTPIDGPGNILGATGVCALRLQDDLPVYGVMFFDTDDLDFIDSFGLLDEVITHEMGHALGFGSVWDFPRPLLKNVGSRNPRFTGPTAVKAWHELGGRGQVPVEGQFGPGTALSHWDEDTFGNELMTGFIDLGESPLSNLSALSMKDLGYVVAAKGDPYELPAAKVASSSRRSGGIDLVSGERSILPKGAIR